MIVTDVSSESLNTRVFTICCSELDTTYASSPTTDSSAISRIASSPAVKPVRSNTAPVSAATNSNEFSDTIDTTDTENEGCKTVAEALDDTLNLNVPNVINPVNNCGDELNAVLWVATIDSTPSASLQTTSYTSESAESSTYESTSSCGISMDHVLRLSDFPRAFVVFAYRVVVNVLPPRSG